MKLLLPLLTILLFISLHAQEEYTGQTIQEILELPEEQINIGIATLVLAKEFYPDMDVNFFLYSFDYLADRFSNFFGQYSDSESRIRALNTYLYQKGTWNDGITFGYDDDDLQVTKRDNKFINGYIATKKGSCITMPMLYLILGERLNFPIYPVRSAKHFFVRYISKAPTLNFEDNIEATNGGSYISDEQYQQDVLIPEKAIQNGVYLRTLSKKEYLATLLSTNAGEYFKEGNWVKAKEYLQLALKYDPTFSGAYWNYGILHLEEARKLEALMDADKQAEVTYYQTRSKKMANSNPHPLPNNNFYNTTPNLNIIWSDLPIPNMADPSKEFSKYSSFPNPSVNQKQPTSSRSSKQPFIHPKYQTGLQISLIDIERKYIPLINAKIEVFKNYTNMAEELGIVKKFPVEFFIKQAESLKQFKEKGGY